MYIQSFQNAAGSKIAVTGTATNIFDLINTSQSTTLPNAGFSGKSNAIIIQPEDGNIRFLFNNQVPTATNGFKVSSGSIATLVNVPLSSLQLIRTGGSNVNCSVQIGLSDASESSSVIGAAGVGFGGSTQPNVDSYGNLPINLAAGADQQLVAAPGANKQIWVYGYQLTVNTAGTVSFQDEDNTASSGVMPLDKGIAVTPSGNFAMPLFKCATNKALEVDVVICELDGTLQYGIISV